MIDIELIPTNNKKQKKKTKQLQGEFYTKWWQFSWTAEVYLRSKMVGFECTEVLQESTELEDATYMAHLLADFGIVNY